MRRAILMVATVALTVLVASGVALAVTKIGTNGPDTLRGTNGADNLVGLGGNDRLFALDGRDNLLGGPGKDWVGTHPRLFEQFRTGDKNLQGGPGNDIVFGGRGSDNVLGDTGNDFLIDGPTRESSLDKVSLGDGNDVLLVENVPVAKDIVTCGGGFDRVLADRKDLVAPDCERVRIVRGSSEEVSQQREEFFASIPQSFFEGLQPGVL
jgi:RTX calcium-binding nonapeptide repeat (4 copies)